MAKLKVIKGILIFGKEISIKLKEESSIRLLNNVLNHTEETLKKIKKDLNAQHKGSNINFD